MEAAGEVSSSKPAVAPITAVIAARVKHLREESRISGPKLAARLAGYGLNWTRTTVAKFETGLRSSITVQELLALALALDVPPIMLLADPRQVDKAPAADVPVTDAITVPAWEALLWLIGSGTIDKSDLGNFGDASWLIHSGWGLVENLKELEDGDRVINPGDPDELDRVQQRDDARHRAALRGIRTAVARIRKAGAPLPPIIPVAAVLKRAAELDVDMPELSGD